MNLRRVAPGTSVGSHRPFRRDLLRAMASMGIGLGILGSADLAAAKKRRKKKTKCKGCTPCQTCQKGKCRSKPDETPCSSGACQGGACRVLCPADQCDASCACTPPAICDPPGQPCCDPEGTPCTVAAGCCSGTCDSLIGGGTCAPCRGRTCSADTPCCGGYDCITGSCDGCRDRAVSCTTSTQCCFSDCVSGACLSAAGGRCSRDADCRACYLGHNCTNACVNGSCAV
jgi:hypothetical protein